MAFTALQARIVRLGVLATSLMVGLSAMPVLAQEAGLSGIAMPQSDGSVMSYMYHRRMSGEKIDGETASRVFGGRKAQDGAWPSQVALIGKAPPRPDQQGDEYFQFCGGSIIARQWILTAAHCVFDPEGKQTPATDILVQTGSNSLGKGDLRAVAAVFPHENYDPAVIDNDVALLKLAEPIGQSAGPVGAISILPAGSPPPQGPGMVIGWGFMEEGKLPNDLMETDIDIVSNATCNKGMAEQTKRDIGSFLLGMGKQNRIPQERLEEAYKIVTDNLGPSLTDNMICAGVANGSKTACNGDSGGPLLVRQADGRWLQVGIVSWGRFPLGSAQHCGFPELYGVYTRASNYYDWIAAKIRQN
ncbi:MAG: serine protease [Cypionkella sp.]|nr:serine protease [Cypionkella sp.]